MMNVLGRILKLTTITAIFAVSSYATTFIGGAYISGGPSVIGDNTNDARRMALLYSQETIADDTDTDGDGLSDSVETNTGVYVSSTDTGTDPNIPDSDGDGLSDGAEINTGTFVSLTDTGTNPNDADTDNDGVSDSLEISEGTDPNNASDFNTFSTGLVAYYPFSGNTNDENGGSNNLVNQGAMLTTDRYGVENRAYSFDGTSSYMENANISIGETYTISFWLKSTAIASSTYLNFYENSNDTHVLVEHNLNSDHEYENVRFLDRSPSGSSGGKNIYSPFSLHDGTWHHITCVSKGDLMSLFVNGSKVS
ncbi:MAG: LamG-like jellyroll fold domain-containing protein, partial [Verrucomicrobiota bacterium]|nr:LamG-like jellyroll fold domain-containing protein [Verrucomicrobiota bacterium]